MIEILLALLCIGVAVFAGLWATSTHSRLQAETALKQQKEAARVLKTKYELQVERNKVLRDERKKQIEKDLETRSPGDVLDDFVNARSVLPDKNKD